MRFSRNDLVLLSCAGVVAGMVGLSYAAVPLYYIFCRATGYGGVVAKAENTGAIDANRSFTVSFDTNVDPALPWRFTPESPTVQIKAGENKLVFFRATNTSDKPIVGHAAYNVTPADAALYFKKIQCFCFTQQRLEPGETVEMPVTFFVDPAISKNRDDDDVSQITLSYTFYLATNQQALVEPAKGGG